MISKFLLATLEAVILPERKAEELRQLTGRRAGNGFWCSWLDGRDDRKQKTEEKERRNRRSRTAE